MDQGNITFSKNQDKSYTINDLHILGYNISFGTKILIIIKILMSIKYLKKSNRKFFVRYNGVNNKNIVPLQIKINNFSFGELEFFADSTAEIDIGSDDEEFFIKYWEIWNKIIELIGIKDPNDFVQYYFDKNGDDAEDEFIMLNIEKKYKRY